MRAANSLFMAGPLCPPSGGCYHRQLGVVLCLADKGRVACASRRWCEWVHTRGDSKINRFAVWRETVVARAIKHLGGKLCQKSRADASAGVFGSPAKPASPSPPSPSCGARFTACPAAAGVHNAASLAAALSVQVTKLTQRSASGESTDSVRTAPGGLLLQQRPIWQLAPWWRKARCLSAICRKARTS